MSPEQIESASSVDPRTDLWSLGVILYEALAGRPPFDDDLILGLWQKIKQANPEPIPTLRTDCPAELWLAIARCLQKDPNARFANLGELAQALAPFAPERSRTCVGRTLWLTETTKVSTIKSSLFTDSYDRVTTNPPQHRRRWAVAGGLASFVGLSVGLLATRGTSDRQLVRVSNAARPARSAMASGEPAAGPSLPVEATAARAAAPSSPIVPASNAPPSEKPPPRSKPEPKGLPRPAPPPPASASSKPDETPRLAPSSVPTSTLEKSAQWLMDPEEKRK
jgi:serine/threonine protein kinase